MKDAFNQKSDLQNLNFGRWWRFFFPLAMRERLTKNWKKIVKCVHLFKSFLLYLLLFLLFLCLMLHRTVSLCWGSACVTVSVWAVANIIKLLDWERVKRGWYLWKRNRTLVGFEDLLFNFVSWSACSFQVWQSSMFCFGLKACLNF